MVTDRRYAVTSHLRRGCSLSLLMASTVGATPPETHASSRSPSTLPLNGAGVGRMDLTLMASAVLGTALGDFRRGTRTAHGVHA